MLTREVMGVLALAILWVNALLVAGAAAKQVAALLGRRAALGGVRWGRVVRGDGPDGALAARRIEQVGRAGADGASIWFHDRSASGQVFGGVVALSGGDEELVRASEGADVWLAPDELARAGACPSAEAFEQAYAPASKAKGLARTLTGTITAGTTVFVAPATHGEAPLVATMEPCALLLRRAYVGAAFIALELLAAAACTALALQPPAFGAVSTLGGALGLGFFLGVQPLGTAVRDAMLVPSRAPVRGRWVRAGVGHGADPRVA